MTLHVGDVILRPFPPRVRVDQISNYVMVVTDVKEAFYTGITGAGVSMDCPIADATVIATHVDVIKAFTAKGAELCARAEQG